MIKEFKFTPLEEFEWFRVLKDDEGNELERHLIGQYIPGMSYNCTKETRHDALREKCKTWQAEGKIRILSLAPGEVFKTIHVSQ